ncbi:MAG: hypothetical protein M3Q55_02635 [Acidobacteriota bacterium]|nr:hypothetical protein [Acidobacteriota bacterium]
MGKEHTLLLVTFLGAIGAQLVTAPHWQDVATPAFLGAALVQVGVLIRGFYVHTDPDPDKYIVTKKSKP